MALPDAVDERVVDRVLHQFVEHDRERGRDFAGQLACVAVDDEVDLEVG